MLVLLVRRGGGFGASLFMSKYFGGWEGCVCLLIVIKTRKQEGDKKKGKKKKETKKENGSGSFDG